MVAQSVIQADAETRFLQWLPEIRSRATYYNRYLRPEAREEAECEVVAWAWLWVLMAARKGRLDKLTPRSLAFYATKMFSCGRRFAGSSNTDVMSEQTRIQGRTTMHNLEDMEQVAEKGSLQARQVVAALTKSRIPSPPEMARTDMDYALALKDEDLSPRAKEVFEHLLDDHEHGCLTRIARDMKLSVPSIWQFKERVGEALSRIGYNPTIHSHQPV